MLLQGRLHNHNHRPLIQSNQPLVLQAHLHIHLNMQVELCQHLQVWQLHLQHQTRLYLQQECAHHRRFQLQLLVLWQFDRKELNYRVQQQEE